MEEILWNTGKLDDGRLGKNFFRVLDPIFQNSIIDGPVKSRLTGEPRIRSGAGTGIQGS
jgi:hypothetical protein